MKFKSYYAIAVLAVFLTSAFAQKINMKVAIKMEHLQPRDQTELADLQYRLEDYVNNNEWSTENQDITIQCNMQIIIETVNQRGADKVYKAQFLVGSSSGENYYDKNCQFIYYPGQPFDQQRAAFDPLLALVDYYIYMIMGGEMDTYELMGGTVFYDRAQDIANQGQLSQYQLGWTDRLEEVIQNTDGYHAPLREAKFYFYEGLYFVEEEVNPENVRKFSRAVVERLHRVWSKQPNSKVLKRFLDAHYQEFPKLLQYDLTDENINKMVQIDPRHKETYLNISRQF
ncbi:MAG: hypothetical protein Kow0037_31420 [Calditrichia bacterium]